MLTPNKKQIGFTLIELSIVLVIIGLIVGGVLVGRDLIKSSEIRAQLSQIEQFRTAMNSFRIKYNALPGDIRSTDAAAFGLFASGNGPARAWGDGNGILEAGNGGCNLPGLTNCFYGEFLIFFRHLSDAQFIDGSYGKNNDMCPDDLPAYIGRPAISTTPQEIERYMPRAKIGKSSFLTTYSYQSTNYFALAAFTSLGSGSCNGYYGATAAVNPLSGVEAYSIDKKIDDGNPNTGLIRAIDTARNMTTLSLWVALSAITNCVAGGTNYNIDNEDIGACSLSIKF